LDLFIGAAVENCTLNSEDRSLKLKLICAEYILRKDIISLENKIKSALNLNAGFLFFKQPTLYKKLMTSRGLLCYN
ncbi:MAG: hypothetical protein IIW83_01515, partial [Clostridia bacterium]|nr:hypothetical protein [Clostridia bacterium]